METFMAQVTKSEVRKSFCKGKASVNRRIENFLVKTNDIVNRFMKVTNKKWNKR